MEKELLFDDPRGWSPYGVPGRHLGLAAIKTAEALADEPSWDGDSERSWLRSDYLAFNQVIDFADDARRRQTELFLCRVGTDPYSQDRREHFSEWISEFHIALPFSEGERHWLIERVQNPPSTERKADAIRRRTGQGIYEAGRRRDIRPAELLDAFWAWRRDIFEFEDTGSLDIAIDALRSIGQILLRNVPDYASYISPPNILKLDAVRKARRAQREAEQHS
jgi:hypothetical protein